jgi:hypothetical protein
MSGKEVIRAAQMFTTTGVASRTSVAKEIVIGMVLGLGAGMVWQASTSRAHPLVPIPPNRLCVQGRTPDRGPTASAPSPADLALERGRQVGLLLQGAGGEAEELSAAPQTLGQSPSLHIVYTLLL